MRPDARIRLGATIVGNNVYSGTQQVKVRSSRPKTFVISLQNDGSAPDSFTVQGPDSGILHKVRYTSPTGADITSALDAGTFVTPRLAPGTTYVIRARVSSTFLAGPSTFIVRTVTATSVADPSKSDAVTFKFTTS